MSKKEIQTGKFSRDNKLIESYAIGILKNTYVLITFGPFPSLERTLRTKPDKNSVICKQYTFNSLLQKQEILYIFKKKWKIYKEKQFTPQSFYCFNCGNKLGKIRTGIVQCKKCHYHFIAYLDRKCNQNILYEKNKT